MNKTISAMVAALILSMNLHAGESDHGERHFQQEAHLHGLAAIMLAFEGDKIELQLESPAANIVGFEHRASTPAQQRTVNEAKAKLESPTQLFSFTGTQCEVKELKVNVSAVLSTEENENEEKTHDEHHEKDAHEHEHEHEDHHDESNHEESEHETHSEVSANYQFHCQQGSKLTAIDLHLFEYFPGIETLKAVWVTDTSQGSTELTAKSTTIGLR